MKPSTIQDLKAEAIEYRQMADRIDEFVEFATRPRSAPDSTIPPSPPQNAEVRHRFRRVIKLTQADAAEQVFKNLRRPLTKPQLIEEVVKMGATVSSPESFASVLSRENRFRPIGDGTWFLSSAFNDDKQGKLNGVEK